MEKVIFLWIVGDPSGDGYDKYESVPVEIETKNKEKDLDYIKHDFEKECKDIGLNTAKWFTEYLDHKMSEGDYNKLKEMGCPFEDIFDPDRIGWYDFFTIWLFLLNHLRPDLKAKELKLEKIKPSGGYGLFE